eukprot:2488134-Alexandrium_andersonii.AAC.1
MQALAERCDAATSELAERCEAEVLELTERYDAKFWRLTEQRERALQGTSSGLGASPVSYTHLRAHETSAHL